MTTLLKNKNALVTGSARGIGKAIALRFADEGANVVVNYMEQATEAEAVVAEARSRGVKSFAVKADIGISSDVRNLIRQVHDQFPTLDVLVNNAGRGLSKHFHTIQEDEWERTIAVHLKGVFLTCQLAGEIMRKQKRGSIINISSVAGRVALPFRTIYSTVEAGKDMFTRSLACEWAADGVRVNSIAPGTIRTDLVRKYRQGQSRPHEHPAAHTPRPLRRTRRSRRACRFPCFRRSFLHHRPNHLRRRWLDLLGRLAHQSRENVMSHPAPQSRSQHPTSLRN